jgi:DNA adenine methylase
MPRIGGVVIENKDFENLIKVYDRKTAFFYCDPPYFKAESYYDVSFGTADHERLNDCLNGIKGLFMLSYDDHEFIRKMYKNYNIRGVTRANNLSSGEYKEVVITNY